MERFLLCLLVSLVPALALAQGNPAAEAARRWRQQHERAILDEFVALLSIPNVSRDRDNVQRNAELIVKMMAARGVAARLVSVDGANPVVFGEIRTPGASRTIVFYAHYDGQPLDPKEWTTPPFAPVLRNGPVDRGGAIIPLPPPGTTLDPEARLYARSAGDDKAPIISLLTALDAIRAAGLGMQSNVKFVFDGEEEAGSPQPDEDPDGQQGPLLRRRLVDVRRSGSPDEAADDLLRRARRRTPRCDGVRAAGSSSTAGTTAIGRRTLRCCWPVCSRR